ncbi:MAG TPA: hypothetical protein VLE94_06750 [Burkholderiaceae bacterium]|nr:hypothetical protein [Burkholderiaceae bacterium]
MSALEPPDDAHYELRFRSLFNQGRGYAFPCDAAGHVDLDTLSRPALNNYLYARAVVGREFRTPAVERSIH